MLGEFNPAHESGIIGRAAPCHMGNLSEGFEPTGGSASSLGNAALPRQLMEARSEVVGCWVCTIAQFSVPVRVDQIPVEVGVSQLEAMFDDAVFKPDRVQLGSGRLAGRGGSAGAGWLHFGLVMRVGAPR